MQSCLNMNHSLKIGRSRNNNFTQPPKIEGVECPVCYEGVLILKKVVKAHSGDVALMLKMDVKLFSLMLMVNLLFMNVPDCHKEFLKQRKGSKVLSGAVVIILIIKCLLKRMLKANLNYKMINN